MSSPPQITDRQAQVAVIMLDTRVGGRYIARDAYRKAGVPIILTARRIAERLGEAAGKLLSPQDVQGGARALCSRIPTHQLRDMAARLESAGAADRCPCGATHPLGACGRILASTMPVLDLPGRLDEPLPPAAADERPWCDQ